MSDATLKPCPFCGGEAIAITGPVKTLWGATCIRCSCWLDDRAPTSAEAIAAWNTRADADEIAKLQARVAEVEAANRGLVRLNEATEARAEAAEAARRMIVSHATGGETTGEGMSVNDISVRITAFRNVLWEEAKGIGAEAAEAALARAYMAGRDDAARAADYTGAIQDQRDGSYAGSVAVMGRDVGDIIRALPVPADLAKRVGVGHE